MSVFLSTTLVVYDKLSGLSSHWLSNYCTHQLQHPYFCQLRYQFEVSNTLGSVKGCVALVVQEGEEEDEVNLKQNFESNPVTQGEFGEYVASLHSCNNSTFVLQYEVIQYSTVQ